MTRLHCDITNPAAVRFHHELQQRVPDVLAAHQVDRAKVCDALEALNKRWGAGEETLKNIDLLREADCVAVVSGQQAGFSPVRFIQDLQAASCSKARRLFTTTWQQSSSYILDEITTLRKLRKRKSLVATAN